MKNKVINAATCDAREVTEVCGPEDHYRRKPGTDHI